MFFTHPSFFTILIVAILSNSISNASERGSAPLSILLSPLGERLAEKSTDGITVFDMEENEVIRSLNFDLEEGKIDYILRFSSDGKKLLVIRDSLDVIIWNLENGKTTTLQMPEDLTYKHFVVDAFFSPVNSELIVGVISDTKETWIGVDPIVIWKNDTGRPQKLSTSNDLRSLLSFGFTPSGNYLFAITSSISSKASLEVWNTQDLKKKEIVLRPGPSLSYHPQLRVHPGKKSDIVAYYFGDSVSLNICDLKTGKRHKIIEPSKFLIKMPKTYPHCRGNRDHGGRARSTNTFYEEMVTDCFSPNEDIVACATNAGKLFIADLQSMAVVVKFRSEDARGGIYRLIFSSNGSTLAGVCKGFDDASGKYYYFVRFWAVKSGNQQRADIREESKLDNILFFDSDKKIIVGQRSKVSIYDVDTGERVTDIVRDNFTDGKGWFSRSKDSLMVIENIRGKSTIWDASTQKEVVTISEYVKDRIENQEDFFTAYERLRTEEVEISESLKILSKLVSNVSELKIFYTMTSAANKNGDIGFDEKKDLIRFALIDAPTEFKFDSKVEGSSYSGSQVATQLTLIAKKAKKDGLLNDEEFEYFRHECNKSNTFADERFTSLVDAMGQQWVRIINSEQNIVDVLEYAQAVDSKVNHFKYLFRSHLKRQAAYEFVGAGLSFLTMGAGGNLLAAVGSGFGFIVDFSDFDDLLEMSKEKITGSENLAKTAAEYFINKPLNDAVRHYGIEKIDLVLPLIALMQNAAVINNIDTNIPGGLDPSNSPIDHSDDGFSSNEEPTIFESIAQGDAESVRRQMAEFQDRDSLHRFFKDEKISTSGKPNEAKNAVKYAIDMKQPDIVEIIASAAHRFGIIDSKKIQKYIRDANRD